MNKQKPWFIKVWNEGQYLDLWTVNHILAGVILAGIFTLWGLNFWIGLSISAALMGAWEVFEIWKKIIETYNNAVVDVLSGVAGYVGMYFVMLNVDSSQSFFILMIATPIWVILETWGFLSYRYEKKN